MMCSAYFKGHLADVVSFYIHSYKRGTPVGEYVLFSPSSIVYSI